MSNALPETPSVPMSRSMQSVLIAYGNFVFRFRDYLAPAAVAVVVVLSRPRPWRGDPRRDFGLDLVGFAVALCGQALRVLVIGLAYIQRGGKNKRIAADRLVTSGMFAHCRHPLYVGNFLLMLGLMIIWNSPWAYVVGIAGVGLSLFAMAYAEETFLLGKFGAEYAAYCHRVNRFIPDLRGVRQTFAGFSFDWKRVVRKEYGTTFTWTTTALVLMVVEHVDWGDAPIARVAAPAALVWLCLAALWGTARWAKKRHLLRSPEY